MLACDLIVEVRASRSVSAEQARDMERSLPAGATVPHETIDFLFRVDRYAERVAPEWTQLLARAVLSGVVLGEAPAGKLTEAKADWLIAKIGNDRITGVRSLELIARVMARAETSPRWLQEMLVELSAKATPVPPARDARKLRALLAENFSTAADSAPVEERDEAAGAEVVPMPEHAPAALPIALAA